MEDYITKEIERLKPVAVACQDGQRLKIIVAIICMLESARELRDVYVAELTVAAIATIEEQEEFDEIRDQDSIRGEPV